jgi:hypothetical protein
VNETNCLWTTNPEIAKLLKDPQRGYEITYGKNTKEEFLCKDCGNVDLKYLHSVTTYGYNCSKCSDGVPFGEKFTISLLEQLNVNYEIQKRFNWSNKRKYDFYLKEYNMIIETHGEQHYVEGFTHFKNSRNLKEERENDKLKEKLAVENGIKKYIVIDCRKSELEFIKTNIINSEISRTFNLSNVDWLKCYEFTSKSRIKIVSDIWNSGVKIIKEIANNFKLHESTTRRYLRVASELGWCDYSDTNNKIQNKPIIQLSLDDQLIRDWNSGYKASKELGINDESIYRACKGKSKNKTAGGFKWMYKEDYEKIIN